MKITNAEKFLLALMICGCLTTGALAADRIENSTDYGEITGQTFENISYSGTGGAISNSGTIEKISGSSFTNNSATTTGGAIYNYTGSIGEISDSSFTNNSAEDYGGAIHNNGTIGTISGCTFDGNYASAASGEFGGGAICSSNRITTIINTSFTNNTAVGDGGAIYNSNIITTIENTSFTNNTAGGNGGAIYNSDKITLENCTFSGNTASSNGGVIYNSGTANINFSNRTAVISGNTANGSANFLYGTASSVTNFNLSDGASLLISDGITGDTGYDVNVVGDDIAATTFCMYDDFLGSDLSFSTTTLNTVDGEIHKYSVNSFTVAGDFNMVADVDLEQETMDRFEAESYGEHEGTLTVTGMNLLSDATDDKVAVYFAEPGLMENVSSDVGKLPDDHQTAVTPRYKYSVYYVYKDEDGVIHDEEGGEHEIMEDSIFTSDSAEGGYFVFHKEGDNPAVLAASYSQMAALNTMNMMFNYNFEHSDYFMKLPAKTRLAMAEWEKAKRAKKQPKETDATKPQYYNQNELTKKSAWVKTFASNEKVSYRGGYNSRDKYYGALVGFDSSLKDHGDGWAHLFTGYVGTIGIRQNYDGGHIRQHGGVIGVTESFYKKNFYAAWTAAAGTAKVHTHTDYGHESNRNDTWGVAAKFGYNLELGDGKFSILPTFTASYADVDPENYTNAADLKMSGSGVHAIQLNPNVKFIMNAENGLQPYVTVGEVWTVDQSSSMRADGDKVKKIEMKPYTEYGVGVQKRWKNEADAYVQFLGHSHGRDGFLIDAGVRWNF